VEKEQNGCKQQQSNDYPILMEKMSFIIIVFAI
jgi:hypothetical protein